MLPAREGLLVFIRSRDWQVGLGCSWWREAQGEEPRDQGSGTGALVFSLRCPVGGSK